MANEPDSLILQLLRDMRAEIGGMRAEIADLRSDMTSLRADIAADLIDVRGEIGGLRKEFSEQIVGLRRAVVEYHTSVIGHGILISELDTRVRRVEEHLKLPPLDPAH